MIRARLGDAGALARTLGRGDFDAIRAAAWALRAAGSARRSMRDGGLATLALPRVPELEATAGRGVDAALRRTRYTCLERAVVRQAWAAAHGERRDVIIGVSSPGDFGAHAWLDGDPPSAGGGFHEILRHSVSAGSGGHR